MNHFATLIAMIVGVVLIIGLVEYKQAQLAEKEAAQAYTYTPMQGY